MTTGVDGGCGRLHAFSMSDSISTNVQNISRLLGTEQRLQEYQPMYKMHVEIYTTLSEDFMTDIPLTKGQGHHLIHLSRTG